MKVRIWAVFMSLLLTLGLLMPPVDVVASEDKVIKVGYIDYSGFIEEEDDGVYSGYAVAYLNEISRYTGWRYEYVYDSWDNCLDKLKNGEIDMLCNAQRTLEREKIYDYSEYTAGVETSTIYVLPENDDIYYEDYKAMDGKNIGFLTDSYQVDTFKKYAKDNHFTYSPSYYATDKEMLEALYNGEIDILATGSLSKHDELKTVGRFGYDPFYFMVKEGNSEVLNPLNEALGEIHATNPFFSAELYNTYYGSNYSDTIPAFTREEAEYIENAGTFTMGSFSNLEPLSAMNEKTGEVEGIYTDVVELISKKSGLKFNAVPMKTNEPPATQVANGDYDIAIGTIWSENLSKTEGIDMTSSFMNMSAVAVGKQGTDIDSRSALNVAVPATYQYMIYYIETKYPDYNIILYDDIVGCLDAVVNGEADIAVQNSMVVNEVLDNPHYDGLSIIPSFTVDEPSCMIVSDKEDRMLVSILDKTIESLDQYDIDRIVTTHTVEREHNLNLSDTIYKYRDIVGITVLLFAMCVFLLVLALVNYNRVGKKNKELAIALAAAQKSDMAKQDFLSHMSHEIRTPLNGIKGMLDIIQSYPDMKEDKNIKNALYATKHLASLVNDILDMSKIESGKFTLHKEIVARGELLNYIVNVIKPMAMEKNIDLQVDIDSKGYDFIEVDSKRVRQIMFNLLSNAIKYTAEGGKVTFTVHTKLVDNNKVDVTFIVEDNGIGMKEEFQDKMFDPFEQEEQSQTRMGTGLGLPITKRLVEAMKGTIEVDSTYGEGTKVTVCICVDIVSVNDPRIIDTEGQKIEELKVDFTGKRALLAEDNELNREIVKGIFASWNLDIDEAVDGEEAVNMYRNSKEGYYDIIFMDIMMPHLDGLQATRSIRSMDRPDAKEVVIVAMTANAFIDDINKSMESGMNYHLSKPFDKLDMKKILLKSL